MVRNSFFMFFYFSFHFFFLFFLFWWWHKICPDIEVISSDRTKLHRRTLAFILTLIAWLNFSLFLIFHIKLKKRPKWTKSANFVTTRQTDRTKYLSKVCSAPQWTMNDARAQPSGGWSNVEGDSSSGGAFESNWWRERCALENDVKISIQLWLACFLVIEWARQKKRSFPVSHHGRHHRPMHYHVRFPSRIANNVAAPRNRAIYAFARFISVLGERRHVRTVRVAHKDVVRVVASAMQIEQSMIKVATPCPPSSLCSSSSWFIRPLFRIDRDLGCRYWHVRWSLRTETRFSTQFAGRDRSTHAYRRDANASTTRSSFSFVRSYVLSLFSRSFVDRSCTCFARLCATLLAFDSTISIRVRIHFPSSTTSTHIVALFPRSFLPSSFSSTPSTDSCVLFIMFSRHEKLFRQTHKARFFFLFIFFTFSLSSWFFETRRGQGQTRFESILFASFCPSSTRPRLCL